MNKKRIYEFNPKTGYQIKANLNCSKTVNSVKLKYITDKFGVRVRDIEEQHRDSIFPESELKRRILIAGDSFAEGQTDVEFRFDYQINNLSEIFHATSVGCGGYGPSQQVLLAQEFLPQLRSGDIFILLTCGNDFGDILRKSVFGRSKPLLLNQNNRIMINPPNDSFLYSARDKSYFLGYSLQFLDAYNMKWNFNDIQVKASHDTYSLFVEDFFKKLKKREITPFILLHSLHKTKFVDELEIKLHSKNLNFLNLSDSLSDKRLLCEDNFHWNKQGNLAVAHYIINSLNNILNKENSE